MEYEENNDSFTKEEVSFYLDNHGLINRFMNLAREDERKNVTAGGSR